MHTEANHVDIAQQVGPTKQQDELNKQINKVQYKWNTNY
jgi:hypothetical protein